MISKVERYSPRNVKRSAGTAIPTDLSLEIFEARMNEDFAQSMVRTMKKIRFWSIAAMN